MQLMPIDFGVILSYLICVLIVGFLFRKISGKNKEEYFLAGRNIPWWLAGISIVATTYAADTPLAICGIIASKGLSGNGGTLRNYYIFRCCMAKNRGIDRCSVYFN
jgi:Na+/proline symporter